jgi:DNA-binding HxlR family transcriptional regulator
MRRTSFAGMACSIARSLELIGDWWNPLIVRDLYLGLHRFDDLVGDLGISRNLLVQRLAALVEAGIVAREPYSVHPPRDRYVLTPAGEELVPVLMALAAWGDRWATPEGGPPVRFEHRGCGHEFVPTVACPSCNQPIQADAVVVRPGPGGRRGPGTRLVAKLLADSGETRIP